MTWSTAHRNLNSRLMFSITYEGWVISLVKIYFWWKVIAKRLCYFSIAILFKAEFKHSGILTGQFCSHSHLKKLFCFHFSTMEKSEFRVWIKRIFFAKKTIWETKKKLWILLELFRRLKWFTAIDRYWMISIIMDIINGIINNGLTKTVLSAFTGLPIYRKTYIWLNFDQIYHRALVYYYYVKLNR